MSSGPNLSDMMGKFKDQFARTQEELRQRVVEGSAGGGMVIVKMNCSNEVVSVTIKPEIINPESREMLEELVTAAVNQAIKASQDISQEYIGRMGNCFGLDIKDIFRDA